MEELSNHDNPHVITLKECGVEDFLIAKKIRHSSYRHSKAYKFIQMFYRDYKAQRSGIPYIYHIDEGLAILNKLNTGHIAEAAYCLHPYYQSDEAFNENFKYHIPDVLTSGVALAMEYRRIANSYLSKDNVEEFVGFSCPEVRDMLIADKVQNYKDFLLYHKGTHERSDELDIYFNNWFKLLNINYEDFSNIIT
jgi:(p)ppGpp synthase/HD superfamily hydrolase